VKPELVLVTGDIVDTPRPALFTKAREALEKLNQGLGGRAGQPKKYIVCAGNHDRHTRGNAFPWDKAKSHFDAAEFPPASVEAPYSNWIGSEPHRWRILVATVDSSKRARYSAQAFLDEPELTKIKALKNWNDPLPPNLVLLLIHHHLLPLPASEGRKHSVYDLIRPTAAVNPGTILEHIAESLVDIVIHGHEHKRNLAGYISYRPGTGQLAVVAAGSATGMQTLAGCDVRMASFNVLELRPDRSVWTCEYAQDASNNWHMVPASETELLDSTTLRRNRFMRLSYLSRTAETVIEKEASGEWQKHFILTEKRDAIVRETRTGWRIENGEFGFSVQNDTGQPAHPEASFEFDAKEEQKAAQLQIFPFEAAPGQPGVYQLRLELGRKESILARSITTSYRWLDAVILTDRDFALIDKNRARSFRSSYKEFVAATVPIPLHNLTLSVTFPTGYYPAREQVEVYTQPTDRLADPLLDGPLARRLQFTGQTILLHVPFPLVNYRYCIVWTPVRGKPPTAESIKFREDICKEEPQFAKKFLSALRNQPWSELATVAIYVPTRDDETADVEVVRADFARGPKVPTDAEFPPQRINLRGNEGHYRHAWWGERIAIAEDYAKREGMLTNEAVVMSIPVQGLGVAEIPPWGILRLGIIKGSSMPDVQNASDSAAFRRILDLALLSMLYNLN
jgi:predicted phosphodiesterase